jgi:hypothetical protein
LSRQTQLQHDKHNYAMLLSGRPATELVVVLICNICVYNLHFVY